MVVEGKKEFSQNETITVEMAIERAKLLLGGGRTLTDAAKQIAKETGLKKSDIYKGLIEG